jgi:hypothetical protein
MLNSKLLVVLGLFAGGASLVVAETPRGTLLELHSCEVYAGGCIVSSESTTSGHYMLRAWQLNGGSYAGTDLKDLCFAALQSAPSENLAAQGSKSGEAVVYLPQSATKEQREALLSWLKASQPDFKPAHLETRIVPLSFTKEGPSCSLLVGDAISVRTAPLETCDTGACGEALWYSPRSSTSVFAVEVDRTSKVNEPLLKLRWTDSGKRSVFLARFGDSPAQNQYVTTAELCGGNRTLF